MRAAADSPWGRVRRRRFPPGAAVPVLAFAVIALVLAVLITGNVVSAAMVAAYRRIGVLKSIGFTPAEEPATRLAQPFAGASRRKSMGLTAREASVGDDTGFPFEEFVR